MLARTLSALSMLVLVNALAGCSGASSSEISDEPSAANANAAVPAPAKSPSAPPSTGAPAAKPAKPTAPTTVACTPEAEPNNARASATVFTTHVCGTISGNDDVDYVAFEAPSGAIAVMVDHTETGGDITYRYFVDDVEVLSLGDLGEPLLAFPGKKYAVEARSAQHDGAHPTYEITIAFD